MATTKKYKLRQGYTFLVPQYFVGEPPGTKELQGGDTVELTDYEAKPILYMFEQPGDAPVAEKSLEAAVGDDLAAKLHEAGVHSLKDVRDAGGDLGRLAGITPVEAKKAREAAKV